MFACFFATGSTSIWNSMFQLVYMLCNKSILIFGLNLGLNLKRVKKNQKMSSIILMHSNIKKIVLKANIRLKGFVWRYIYSFQFGKFSKIYILCVSNCVQIKNKISLKIGKIFDGYFIKYPHYSLKKEINFRMLNWIAGSWQLKNDKMIISLLEPWMYRNR